MLAPLLPPSGGPRLRTSYPRDPAEHSVTPKSGILCPTEETKTLRILKGKRRMLPLELMVPDPTEVSGEGLGMELSGESDCLYI